MTNPPDFTDEARAIDDALASAYRRGCADTIARLMAGVAPPAAAPAVVPAMPAQYPARRWNDPEDELLRSEWGKSSPETIGGVLQRSADAVRLRATKLGLPRLPRYAFMKGPRA